MPAINGSVAAHIAALTASTVQTFALSAGHRSVTVTVHGASPADVFFTVGSDGVTPANPTVNGTDCYIAPGVAGGSKRVLVGNAPTTVSVITTGTCGVSVEGGIADLVAEA